MFSFGLAKQLSLSSTSALISGLSPPLATAKALDIGIGSWSKVDTVACGIDSEGRTTNLKIFNVAETFIRNQ